jgi:hypothetical protein
MTMKPYVPKRGSHAAHVLAIMRQADADVWHASAALARQVGVNAADLRLLLAAAVKHELLELKRGKRNLYRLGARAITAPGEPASPPLPAGPGLPPRSVFDLRDEHIPMPTGARFGVWADGRINISRAGRVTEQLSPTEARDLARVLRERATEEEGA